MRQVATVTAIVRYPVKSMRGEPLASSELTLQGLPEDRRYAFVQAGSRSAFPWLTGREYPRLLLYQPSVSTAEHGSVLQVTDPSGGTHSLTTDAFRHQLEEASGRPLFLLCDYRGNYDVAQVSVITAATIARIAAESGTPIEPGRFRANLYLETPGGEAFAEDAWVGGVLRFGDVARVAITEPDERCVMITLDPNTSEPTKEVLTAVARVHGNVAGVYGSVLTPGALRVGDPVFLE